MEDRQAPAARETQPQHIFVPAIVIAELQRLPAARAFPASFVYRRRRAAVISETAAAAPHVRAPPAPPLAKKQPDQARLDPTGSLLTQAAYQLSRLVKQQTVRHLHEQAVRDAPPPPPRTRERDAAVLAASRAASLVEDQDYLVQQLQEGAMDDHAFLSTSMNLPDTAASTSVEGGASGGSSHSENEPAAAAAATGKPGRARPNLQRQYAIDFAGLCRLGESGKRMPLPAVAGA
ncbi:hypothetical protein D9Q98_007438 [Chlorella vulgaris]|uniref:Uncharacterized protein n=1 Tax=Chlorella vulgaris TaxID=3077 RepID=A0A9D4TM35_CHLVU|nr:hypothetical protein D9Q98_007438 [Chlorella vulgaris]